MTGTYLVALGSNRRHPRHGPPRRVIHAALRAMDQAGLAVMASSRVVDSRPLGPSLRMYANAAAVVASALEPPQVLALLQRIEREFGRVRGGRRWGERVLDLDIVLWKGGCWADEALVVPHKAMRERMFVLGPAREVAGTWRDPLTGLTMRQLHRRLERPRP